MKLALTEGPLKTHPFMEGADAVFLNHLNEQCTLKQLKPDEILIHAGEYADMFYLIVSGSIRLELKSTNGEIINLNQLGPGEAVGWSWLYPPFEWHLSARAIDTTEVLALKAAPMLVRAHEDAVFGRELYSRISKQVIHRLEATFASITCFNHPKQPATAELKQRFANTSWA